MTHDSILRFTVILFAFLSGAITMSCAVGVYLGNYLACFFSMIIAALFGFIAWKAR